MPGRVLKGEQVTFQISVINPGTGPARNVTVQAKLSSGLQYGGDDIVEQTIERDRRRASASTLDPLIVNTVAGGKQTCTVDVRSPDVTQVLDDQRLTRFVEVTKPDLAVKLEGQTERFTGQTNEYKLTVTNPGTAQAKKVKVVATMPPQGGKLLAPSARREVRPSDPQADLVDPPARAAPVGRDGLRLRRPAPPASTGRPPRPPRANSGPPTR